MKLANLIAVSMVVAGIGLSLDMQPAHAWRYGVNNRQQRQQNRIQSGVQSGTLTSKEAARLTRQQNALARQEARYRASGNGLSRKERVRLEREQNQISQNIHRQANDRQGVNLPPVGNPYAYNPPGRPGLYNINNNQVNHQERINQGIQSGELTQTEAQRLSNQQNRFATKEAEMRQDGLTLQERRRLDNMQDNMSRNIYHQKHDGQDQ
ncbi:MAG: hypothetical protein KIT34_13190 [Cyanobacteria bacterium TGS_CYA1]|nr:hypothetical protein [Cyanobacteria bacterium TGS_CYA1]